MSSCWAVQITSEGGTLTKGASSSPKEEGLLLKSAALQRCAFGCAQLLGRADDPKEFIRHGQPEGWTEITLSSGGEKRPVRVYHRIMRSGRTVSEWKLNGALICRFILVIISTVTIARSDHSI